MRNFYKVCFRLFSPDRFAEQVIAVQPEHREVPYVIELQRYHDRLPSNGIVLPPDPLVTLLSDSVDVQSEVIDPLFPIDQLTHSSGEAAILDDPVVRDVVKVNVAATRVTLRHAVRHDSICDEKTKWLLQNVSYTFFST